MRKVLAVIMCLVLCLGFGQSFSFAEDVFTLTIDQGSCTVLGREITLTGVANRDCTVSFSVSGSQVAKLDVKANVKFTQKITDLLSGDNKFRVGAMDANFNTSNNCDFTVRSNDKAPMMTIDQIPNFENTITKYTLPDYVDTTKQYKFTVSGKLSIGGQVSIYINDSREPIIALTKGLENKFSAELQLKKGVYTLYVSPKSTNGVGGTSAYMYFNVSDGGVVDIIPPTITLDQKTATVASPELTISGTMSEKGYVQYKLNSTSWVQLPLDENLKYSTKITLKEGKNDIRLQGVDEQNNVSKSTTQIFVTYEKDYDPPVITLDQSTSTVSSATFTLSGILNEKGKIKVTVNDTATEATTDANNKFSTNLTLKEGANEISVVAVDEAGNTSDPSKLTITLKKKDPVRPNTEIAVMIDGEYVDFADVPPSIINGRTMVPMRKIFEVLGATIEWNGDTKTVTGTKGETKVVLTIDNKTAYINGQAYTLDTPATILNGRTMVPARFIAESLKANVTWDAAKKDVVITTK